MPVLTTMAEQAAVGCLVKPLFHQWVMDPAVPIDFTFRVQRPAPRQPDGWFHASQHPLATTKELYQWLARPERYKPEVMGYPALMSVMFGSLSHAVIERFLDYMGVAVPLPEGDCPACGRPYLSKGKRQTRDYRYCEEHGGADLETMSRCHLDSVLDFGDGQRGFDFKCLAPETPVSMADGSLQPAGKVSAGDLILGWDEEQGTLVPRRVLHAWDNGIVPVLKVRTRSGRELLVTDEHQFLTRRGWIKVKDLIPFRTEWKYGRYRPAEHDAVRTAWGDGWWSGDAGSSDQAALLGILVGDGGLTGTRVNLTNNDPGVTEFVASYVSKFGCFLKQSGRTGHYYISAGLGASGYNGGNYFLNLLRQEGLMGQGSYEKLIPQSVWTGGPAAWAGFLSGYLDADGSVRNDPGSYPLVKWTSVNRDLLLECQVLLSYLGIKSSVNIHRGRYRGTEHISWNLWVRDARSVARAQQVLQPHHIRKREMLSGLVPAVRADGKFVRDNLAWDPIIEVSRQIARPTIAIEVEGHNHVTAGLITHNSIYQFGLKGVPDMNAAAFREKWPGYWAQMQECMRMTGLRRYIVFFLTLGNPWDTREFHFDFDPEFAGATRQKYLNVISHWQRGVEIVG